MKLKKIPVNASLSEVIEISNKNFKRIEKAFNSAFMTIESVVYPIDENLPDNILDVTYGTSYDDVINNLPQNVTVKLEDETEIVLDVEWNTSEYDQNMLGDYIFSGSINLIDGVINPNNIKAEFTVRVISAVIVGFQAIDDINIEVGSTLESLQTQLPEVINVILNSEIEGSTTYTTYANWTYDNFDSSVPNQFRVIALPSLPDYIINTNQIEFEVFVNVN